MGENTACRATAVAAVTFVCLCALLWRSVDLFAAEIAVDAKQAELAGWQAFEAGRLEEARGHFDAAVQAGNVGARKGLAEVYRRLGDSPAAAAQFRVMLQDAPRDEQIRRDLAGTLASMPEHRAEAVILYQQLAAEHPDDHALIIDQALTLSWSGRYAEARALFTAVLAEDLRDDLRRRARQGLADTEAWAGQHGKAVKIYRQLLAGQHDAPALRGLADVERWRGRPGHAAELYRQAAMLDHDHQPTREGLRLAEQEIRPALAGELQYFQDSSDWRRWRGISAVTLHPAVDLSLDLGVDYAHYRDGEGHTAERAAWVSRMIWRFDTFARLEAELAVGGASGNHVTATGGLGLTANAAPELQLGLHYRHDLLIDDVSPFDYRPYNSASTVEVLTREMIQTDTVRLEAVWAPLDGLNVLAQAGHGWVDDGNHRVEFYLGTILRLHESDAWRLLLKNWYHRNDYDEDSELYFAPQNLQSIGAALRFEAKRPPLRPYLEVGGFYQPSPINDPGFQISGGLDWTINDYWSMGLAADYLNSAERGGDKRYEAGGVRVYLTVRF